MTKAIEFLTRQGYSQEYIRKLLKDGEQAVINAAIDLGFRE